MKRLYIELEDKKEPLDEKIISKYNLEVGEVTPFTKKRILNEKGEFFKSKPVKRKADLSQHDDTIDEMENGLALSTAEILDISQGVDSDMTPKT